MNHPKIILVFVTIALGLLFTGNTYAQVAATDTTLDGHPYYKNVDVLINYGWGDPERINNVNAIIKMEKKVAVAVIVEKPGGTKIEFTLKYGIVIKLFDHKTGKLLRTLTEPKVST